MAERKTKWIESALDLARLLVIVSPLLIVAFGWAKSIDNRVVVLETRQAIVVETLKEISAINKETAAAIADLRIQMAKVEP